MAMSKFFKAGAAFAATSAFALGAAGAANAVEATNGGAAPAAAPIVVSSGHVDAVEVECDNGVYEIAAHIGTTHVPASNIGNYQFLLDESNSLGYITWSASGTSGYYTALTGNTTTMPDIGFAYEASGTGCAAQIGIDMVKAGTSPTVKFEATTAWVAGYKTTATNTTKRLALTSSGTTDHIHGTWTYGPVSHTANDFSIGFNVYNTAASSGGTLLGSISPVKIKVQP